MSQEIILNLWYLCDGDGFIYSLRARAHVGTGTEKENLEYLRKQASVDYLIASIFPIPEQFHIDGQPVFHMKAFPDIGGPIVLFRDAINSLQKDLPSQTHLNIPDSPLVCITALVADENNHIYPRVDETHYY